MEQLIYLKAAIIRTYSALDSEEDPKRKEILMPICRMFKEPLLTFEETYGAFIREVSTVSDNFDRWVNIQMQLIVDLEEHQGCWTQMRTLYNTVLEGTLGDSVTPIDENFWASSSFVTALAFRIFIDSLTDSGAVR